MIFCLTYFTLTFLLPARSTYLLKEEEQEKGAAALWSVYWPIYFIILLLKNFIPFLEFKTFEIVLLLFFLWLYHKNFRGALYLKEYLQKICEEVEIIKTVIDLLKSFNSLIGLFEEQEKIKNE